MRWLTESVISDISGKKEITCKYVQFIFSENLRVLFLEMLFSWSSRQMFICVSLSACITWCVFISSPLLLRGEIKFKLNWIIDRKAEETALMKLPFVRTKITILIIREIIKHCGKDVFCSQHSTRPCTLPVYFHSKYWGLGTSLNDRIVTVKFNAAQSKQYLLPVGHQDQNKQH